MVLQLPATGDQCITILFSNAAFVASLCQKPWSSTVTKHSAHSAQESILFTFHFLWDLSLKGKLKLSPIKARKLFGRILRLCVHVKTPVEKNQAF